MQNSSSLLKNLGIFLSGTSKKFTLRPAASNNEETKTTLTKPKFKSLSPFKDKVTARKSVVVRPEYKLNKVEVFPNPDNKVLFSPEPRTMQRSPRLRTKNPQEVLENSERKDPEQTKAQLTKIVLDLVLEKVNNKEITSFQQFSDFFADVLKEEHQAGALKGVIKGEIGENELLEKLGASLLGSKQVKHSEIKPKQEPLKENQALNSKETGSGEEKRGTKQEDSQKILKKIKNIQHEPRASTVGKIRRVKYSGPNRNSEESVGKHSDTQETIGNKAGLQGDKAVSGSEYLTTREKLKESKETLKDDSDSDQFVTERSRTAQFLRNKKKTRESNLPSIKLISRLQRTLPTNNTLTEQELTSRLLENTIKNSETLMNMLENPQNPSKTVQKSAETLKIHPKHPGFPVKPSKSHLSRSSSGHSYSQSHHNPAYILEGSEKSSRVSPWVNSNVSRSDIMNSNKSSSQQSSVLTGQAAKFSVSNHFKVVQSKAAEKAQKVYEKQLHDLWTQITKEKSPQNSVTNPSLQKKPHRGSSYLTGLVSRSKKLMRNAKNSEDRISVVKVDGEKNEENFKFNDGSEARFKSENELIPSRSTETLNVPYSNSMQSIRNSQGMAYRNVKGVRKSMVKRVRRSQTTLIHSGQPDKSFEMPACSQFIFNCAEHLVNVFREEEEGKDDLWHAIKRFLVNPVRTPPRSPDIKTILSSLFRNKQIKPETFHFNWPSPSKQPRTFERRLSAFIFKDNEIDEENRQRLIEKQEFLNTLHSRSKSIEKYEFRAFDPDFNPFPAPEESKDFEKLQKKRKFAIKIQDFLEKKMKKKKSFHERCKKYYNS